MEYPEAYGHELGKLIVEREGLDVGKVSRDWRAEGTVGGSVMVTLQIPVFIQREEWEALTVAAWEKVKA